MTALKLVTSLYQHSLRLFLTSLLLLALTICSPALAAEAPALTNAITKVRPCTTRPSTTDFKFKDTTVIIDAGTQHGLRVGMELIVTKPRDAVESIQITKVENTHSEAIMTQAGEDEPGPKTGWRLSTQALWKVKQKK